MFSGLTNQVSSWMGSAKGEQEEKVPTPTENIATVEAEFEKKETYSPTKPGKLEMFSNVKNQIEGIGGWLGSSIPKLRKGEGEAQQPAQEDVPTASDVSLADNSKGFAAQKTDDDDNSSATGGADSGPGSAADSPVEEVKEGQFGNVQSKALAGAKSFGSFIYSAVNKAGKTVSEASAKIKETVEKNTILGDFNKEQEAFSKNQTGGSSNALPPWNGCANEEALKEECLTLSTDKRNFVRSPPAGVDFHFDYDISYPVAMAIMEMDPNLEKMRYDLVPKLITEENFWRNYFYRVSLICQANELTFMPREGDNQSGESACDQPLDAKSNEFISDTLQASKQDIDEVREGMKKLALGPKNAEGWEEELEAELRDYEVVGENKYSATRNVNWQEDIDDILDEKEKDLK
ncbi:PREDICTED: synapse-associated protein of 47 kDa isoform X2 [Nicrophorus vespilloides]|uniref:Synapse-associated protein of 47 kDa isoform X2 n=1 Tax=Nicrophorus vespilloides TaxID=110193 RepID=A0ABM1MMF2_NICVS|nr:PREDICTED: synapse-associated protein of 47 kDa isoform X2 [Nicrophorus vespilloides]